MTVMSDGSVIIINWRLGIGFSSVTVKTEPTFNGADDTREKETEMKNIQLFKDFSK